MKYIIIEFPQGKIMLENINIGKLRCTAKNLCNVLNGTYRELELNEEAQFQDAIIL